MIAVKLSDGDVRIFQGSEYVFEISEDMSLWVWDNKDPNKKTVVFNKTTWVSVDEERKK